MADTAVMKTLRFEGTPALYWGANDAEEGRTGLLEGRGSWRQRREQCDGAGSGQTEAPSPAAATHYAAACVLRCHRLVPTGSTGPLRDWSGISARMESDRRRWGAVSRTNRGGATRMAVSFSTEPGMAQGSEVKARGGIAGRQDEEASGNPLFLEPYWRRHAAASAVVFSGWHRMSYTTTGRFQSVELERQIRRLHRAVGNAVADDKHLVFASGSLQLINALVHALSPDATAASPPSRVVAAAPYYPSYRSQTSMFDGREYRWAGTTALWTNASRTNSTDGFIEFVTSPNNPDAMLRKPVLCSSAAAIVDHAYYWPHFTHIPAAADEDIMMFTISKPSGHAGSRFGWALIRDDKVAERALDYVSNSNMGASRDTQLRMLGIVRFMLANLHGEDDIFGFGHGVMRSRWLRLSAVVSRSRRISLQKIMPEYCTYFNRVREPSPAYAWVKCEREEDGDCYEALLKANIISRTGVQYEASSRYTRISLLKSDDDFDVLMERLQELVDAEKHDDAPNGSSPM